MHSERADDGAAPRAPHDEAQDRLRLQHRADVASAAPRRGLRDGRHPDRRARHVRCRPRLPHARGRDVRLAADATRRPTASCSRSRSTSSSRPSTTRASPTRASTTRCPPEVPYRGYTLKDLTLVPRPFTPAGRVLAADPGRHDARLRVHGQARHPGHARRRLVGGRRHAPDDRRLADGAPQGAGHGAEARRAAVHRLSLHDRRQRARRRWRRSPSTTRRT